LAESPFISVDMTKRLPALPAITAEAVDLYITHLALTGRKRKSARLALIEPWSLWAYRSRNEDLKTREAEALAFYEESIAEDVEDEMQRRGIEGVDEPVFYEGKACGVKRVYSDKLLAMLAKRHIPEYREHITADVNVKAGVLVVGTPLSAQDWEKTYDQQTVPCDSGAATQQACQGADPQSGQGGDCGHSDRPL
jgi:hypothetical protein